MVDTAYLSKVATPFVEEAGCNIVLLQFRREKDGRVLKLLIEKKDSDPVNGSGIDHQTCAAISRALGDALEDDPKMDMQYNLEVSSPGIERPLVCEDDFVRFTGRAAYIKTRQAVNKQKKFTGTLDGLRDGKVQIKTKQGDTIVDIPIDQIANAKLVFDDKMLKTKNRRK